MIEEDDGVSSDPVFRTNEEIATYLGANPRVVPAVIHVVGSPDSPRIIVTPASAIARQDLDAVVWWRGANCGEWEVTFKGESPLDPPGPFSSSGPIGGDGVGDPDIYRYAVRAVDLRTGDWVEEDPDVVMIPRGSL